MTLKVLQNFQKYLNKCKNALSLKFKRQGFSYLPILIFISPVEVVISHLPPTAVLGTFMYPLELSAINILSVSSVPVTSPVVVFTKISPASLSSPSPGSA